MIQTSPPKGSFPGAVAQAFYTVENNKVILTDRDGNALRDPEGRDYGKTLAETGHNAHETAAILLRRFRTQVRGNRVAGFDGPLNYPKIKVV
jgi:hypothetical protein